MTMHSTGRASAVRRAAVLLLLGSAGTCMGQTQLGATWVGNGGAWFNALNWDCQGGGNCIPDNDASFTYWVVVNNGQLCNINGSPTIDRIGMTAVTTLAQQNNTTLTIVGDTDGSGNYGTFSIVGGTYEMNSAGNNTNLRVTGGAGATLFIGGDINSVGRIQMSDTTANRIYGASGTEWITFTNGLEVWGSGQIGANSAQVVNLDCVFRATQPQPMILDPADGLAWVNESFVIAEFDGTVQINPGTFDNNNGWLGANSAGARLLLNGGTIFGGHVQSGSGLFQLNGGAVVGTTCLFGDQNGEGGGLVSAPTSIEDLINHGTVTIANNVQGLRVKTEIRNFGLIELASVGNTTDLILDTDVLLNSGGAVRLDAAAARIFASNGSDRLTNLDNTVHGVGQLGANSLRLDNTGAVVADVTGQRLTIDTVGNDSLNWGEFRASGGGVLRVEADTIDQSGGGLVRALDGSLVELNNCTLLGGGYDSQGSGVVRIIGGGTRLTGATSTATIEIPNNVQGLRLRDGFHNAGLVSMLSVGNTTDLIIETDVALTGGGEIAMQAHGSSSNRVYASGGVFALTNVDNTIRGDGRVGVNATEIVNHGVMRADATGQWLQIDPASTCVNTGLLEAAGGSMRLLGGAYDNSAGQIVAQDSSVVELSSAVVTGGSIVAHAGGNLSFHSGYVVGTAPTVEAGATATVTGGGGGCEDGLNNAGVLTILNNVQTTRFGGAVVNTGVIALESVGNFTEMRLVKDLVLSGGGEVTLAPAGGAANRVFAASGSGLLTNTDNLIRGVGSLGANQMRLANAGVIDADAPGQRLTVDTAGDDSTNSGLMRASGGGILRIDPDTLTQSGGEILAMDGSTTELNGCTIVGGLLSSEGSGTHRIISGATRLVDVVSTASIEVPNNIQGLRIQGSLINNGSVNLRSVGNSTTLVCEGDALLGGDGEIILHEGGGQANQIFAAAGDQTITVGCTVRGSGRLGNNRAQIINTGSVIGDGASGLEIDASGTGFLNRGFVEAPGPQPLVVQAGPFVNENLGVVHVRDGAMLDRRGGDYTQAGGTTRIDGRLTITAGALSQTGGTTAVGGVLEASSGASVAGGVLTGDGLVLGNVNNSGGVVAPGDVSGFRVVDDLTIIGEYTQGSEASLAVVLIADEVGSGLSVTGAVMLDGELSVAAAPGFDPPLMTTYELIQAGGVSGVFTSIDTSALPADKDVELTYLPTRVLATIVASGCPSDWDGNGTVNTLDFIAFLNDWTDQRGQDCSGGCRADLNGDDTVNTQDFLLFLNLWTSGC
ncbi:MAG: GC-type dockerin domain-anchored protein [Phycisphaerales bacterium JB041]